MLVTRVSHSLLAAVSRRHARRKPRSTPHRAVALAMDRDPQTNKYIGFTRKEMNTEVLAGTVKHHDCHAFFVHGDADTWPDKEFEPTRGTEGSSTPPVAMQDALMTAAGGAFKGGVFQFKPGASAVGKVKMNLSETGRRGGRGDEPGDVLMFPQMRRHRLGDPKAVGDGGVYAAFVEDAVVRGDGRNTGEGEALTGAHIFVCTHGNRDARCGLCGPALVEAFRERAAALGMDDVVTVRGCSHTGGHKYAGNCLIFVPEGGVAGDADAANREVKGVWYGYVTPLEIPAILERTVAKGVVIPRLWRGSMGVTPEAHEAMAATEAKRQGESWPPLPSPCDACGGGDGDAGGGNDGGGRGTAADGIGDIEDVGGGRGAKRSGGANDASKRATETRHASTEAAAFPPLWMDRALVASALVGGAGLVAAWMMSTPTE